MSFNKVFGIGLSKTGTTSLCAALDILGLRAGTHRHLRELMLTEWFRGDFSYDYLTNLDAVTDLPIGSFYPALDKRYPGSKFILTIRDKDDWLDSCERFFSKDHERNRDDVRKRSAQKKWFHDATQLSAYGVIDFNREQFASRYDAHEEGIRRYFRNRPDDLLIMSILDGDGWESLCSFLDRPVPDVNFPNVLPGTLSSSARLGRASGITSWAERASSRLWRGRGV